MKDGILNGQVLSVPEVIEDIGLYGQLVAVHGVFYYGNAVPGFVLIPKEGEFDGHILARVTNLDLKHLIAINEPNLQRKLADLPTFCGEFNWQYDAIVIGKPQRNAFGYGASISDIWMMMAQTAAAPEVGMKQRLNMICFGEQRGPSMPWTSPIEKASLPILEVSPLGDARAG
jgi:hypothetical protein